MVYNRTAIVSAALALVVLIAQAAFPEFATPIGNLQAPIFDLIVAILSALAGLNTATATQVQNAQKSV